jgi:hypothetical protein
MKKIIFEAEVVSIDTLTDKSFVGILWEDDDKGIIIQCPDNKFRFLQSTTNSIKQKCSERDSLEELVFVTKRVDTAYKQAFVFDTYKELLTWLAK